MNIQDRKKSFTAEELRQRYNLDGLDNDRKAIQLIKDTINKVEIEFQRFMSIIKESFKEYPNQVVISTWFSDGIPSIPETPEDHLGDLQYDRINGKAYRFEKTINLLDKTLVDDSYRNVNNTTQLDTGLKVTCTESGIQRWTCVPIPNSDELLGKKLTFSADVVRSGNNQAKMCFYYINTNNKVIISDFGIKEISTNGQLKLTTTVASAYPSGTNAIGILLYSTGATTTAQVGDYVEYNNLQLEIGSTNTTYHPYYEWVEKSLYKETLAIENSKADTEDGKRLTFNGTPTTPYTIGDVLIYNNNYYRCKVARESGDWALTDWILYTEYSDDFVAAQTKAELDQFKVEVSEDYVSKATFETTVDSIDSRVEEVYTYTTTVETRVDDNQTAIDQQLQEIRNTVDTNQTATDYSINIINQQLINGVVKFDTGTGYTFDIEGLKINKSDSVMRLILDNNGLVVYRNNDEVLRADSNGVNAENMTVRKFYVQKPIRMERTKSITDPTKIGLGFFYVGE